MSILIVAPKANAERPTPGSAEALRPGESNAQRRMEEEKEEEETEEDDEDEDEDEDVEGRK